MARKLFWRLVAGFAVLAISIAAMPARAYEVVAAPTTYDFYSVYVGRSATMTGTVTNNAGGTVVISDMEWIYNPGNIFSVTSPILVPHPLAAGASVDYQVTFRPRDYSFWTATLRIHTDHPHPPFIDVQFWGFGEFPPDVPTVAVWPLTLGFGEVLMSEGETRTTEITNIGGGDLAIHLDTVGSTDFEIRGAARNFNLSSGEHWNVDLIYKPSDIGHDGAHLVIQHNDTSLMGEILVPLSGEGVRNPELPRIEISTLAMDFGDVTRGSESSQTITITNIGGGELEVYLTTAGSTDFDFPDFPPGTPASFSLSRLEMGEVRVRYSPSDVGDDVGDLVIAHNDPVVLDDIQLPLSGTGLSPVLPNIVVWPLALDFGAVPMGAIGSQTTVITNTGGGLLDVFLTTAGSTDFEFASGTPTRFTLPFGASQAVELLFSPKDVGDDVGNLVIAHNDPDLTDDILVPLTGTGNPPPAATDCDIDADGDIDRNDIFEVARARRQPASGPDDPRDPDENGVINLFDVRICQTRCTLPGCAVID